MSASTLTVALSVEQLDDLAALIAERMGTEAEPDRWLDTRAASAYVGCHVDTLRRAAASRAIPSTQEREGCKLHFRRSDLDRWRRGER